MPKASDGKFFPYTKEGIKEYKKYEDHLNRNNKYMGKYENKDRTENPNNNLKLKNTPNT
jgi:hypothetical protein